VPDEVAVVGVDDIPECAYTHPPLTSIAPDLDVIAERSLSLLDAQIRSNANGNGNGNGGAAAVTAASATTGASSEQAPDPATEHSAADTDSDTEGAAQWSGASASTPFRLVVRESSRRAAPAK
jgi:hypothetical protein